MPLFLSLHPSLSGVVQVIHASLFSKAMGSSSDTPERPLDSVLLSLFPVPLLFCPEVLNKIYTKVS